MLGGLLSWLAGNNRESLVNFIRRMLHELMEQTPNALPVSIDTLGFDQLIVSVPASIMSITEQHDLLRKEGLDTPSILHALHSHRETVMGSLNEGYALDNTPPTTSLSSFILHIIRHEAHGATHLPVSEQYVDHVIRETREFARKNPRNTILATTRRMRKRCCSRLGRRGKRRMG